MKTETMMRGLKGHPMTPEQVKRVTYEEGREYALKVFRQWAGIETGRLNERPADATDSR